MRCPSCQMEVEPGRTACGYCGTPTYPAPGYAPYGQPAPGYYPPPAYGMPPPGYGAPPPVVGYYAPPPQRSMTPVAAGIVLLIGGVLALINGAVVASAGAGVSYVPGLGEALIACAAIEIIFAILAIMGGICAVQRKVWGLALTGAIFCMISIGPMFISSILGLIGLILVAISKQDFT